MDKYKILKESDSRVEHGRDPSGGRRQRSDSLQALRALAFMGIFLDHAGAAVSWPALGVSVFYVLSGFLMVLNYYDREVKVSVKDNMLFSWKKVKKLYPLHIMTMLYMVLLSIAVMLYNGATLYSVGKLFFEILLNATLLQAWYPKLDINVSLNGVSWYLSVIMFLYFMFPYILQWLRKRKNDRILFIVPIAAIAMQLVLCALFMNTLGENDQTYAWMMYCFPVFRLGDFLAGCCVGCIYLKYSIQLNAVSGSVAEIAAVIGTFYAYHFVGQESTSFAARLLHNWTTIYIPIAVVWVVLFTLRAGIITKMLSNRLLIRLGNISAYAFLVHNVITRYCNSFIGFAKLELSGGIRAVLVIGELAVTFILCTFLSYDSISE